MSLRDTFRQPARHLLFTLFYRTFFYLLYLALLGLLLVTPGDAITQALQNNQLYNVFVIAAVYFVTAVLAGLVYVTRVYTTRSVLKDIPREWIPVEEGDVEGKVRRVIEGNLGRSAGVQWLSRPRADAGCLEGNEAVGLARETNQRASHDQPANKWRASKVVRKLVRKRKRPDTGPQDQAGEQNIVCEKIPVWGVISHPGWTGPTNPDLPNLAYTPVIAELPHLIEAKVVALSGPTPENLQLLTRPANMGLRGYLSLLLELGCLDDSRPPANDDASEEKEEKEDTGVNWREWLNDYERARFSGRYPTEAEFRALTAGFASVLDRIRGLQGQESLVDSDSDSDSDWEVVQRDGDRLSPEGSLRSQRSEVSMRQSMESRVLGSEATVERQDFAQLPLHRVPSRNPTPASRFVEPRQARREEGIEMENMKERGGAAADRLSQKDAGSLRSFDTATESDHGSVIRNARPKML